MPSNLPISRQLHSELESELDRLAATGRPVRHYHAADLGLDLIAFICEHREFTRHDTSLPPYSVIVFTVRDNDPRILQRFTCTTWPL